MNMIAKSPLSKRFKGILTLIFLLFSPLLTATSVLAENLGPISVNQGKVSVTQEGCSIKIASTEEVRWQLPRQPIDLVILQDASGSFRNTIGNVQAALRTLTTPVDLEAYDEKNPRLVFTGDPKTTDRVMVASFQGIDRVKYWNASSQSDFASERSQSAVGAAGQTYRYASSNLTSDPNEIQSFIDGFKVDGGTPTVPAIDDTLEKYNQLKEQGGGMANNRKTVFLLITDGVANGYRPQGSSTVYFDSSYKRYMSFYNTYNSSNLEVTNDYIKRSEEVKEAGQRIREAVGEKGTVVVGFWEDVNNFVGNTQYDRGYLGNFDYLSFNNNQDNRSVQEVFHTALQSVASPDKEVNGKNVSFYVNEQTDSQRFAANILTAVTAALVKENVEGSFKVTEGYKLESVTINHKKVVETVQDPDKEIQGKVHQEGQDVTISVPESVFNPGKNDFDYDLSRTEDADVTSEDDEEDPADDYQPSKVERTVGQLKGRFKVGDYETAEIGSREPAKVEVTDLKYCYPSASKSVKDEDAKNDLGSLADPVLKNKQAYAANLSKEDENFSYDILYRMNNAPLEFKENAYLVDALDYRLDLKNAWVEDIDGSRRDDFTILTLKETNNQGQEYTKILAEIPKMSGENSDSVKEGLYGGHKFKRYRLHIEAKIKDAFSFEQNPQAYKEILLDNDGLGILNQAQIVWNGSDDHPEDGKMRRSNTVYVLPPVKTDIKKDVQSVADRGEGYVKDKAHHYLEDKDQAFYYNVESSWPGMADSYHLSDHLVDELLVKEATILVNGKEISQLKDKLKIEGQSISLDLEKDDFTDRKLSRQIKNAWEGQTGTPVLNLRIKAVLRPDADLSKYLTDQGEIKVPNQAKVVLNDQPQDSNVVYVTPSQPSVTKKINEKLDHLDLNPETDYTYNIKSTLPNDIGSYKKFAFYDQVDSDLEIKGAEIVGQAADLFDVQVDGQTVSANLKDPKDAQALASSPVELRITAQIRKGVTREKIPNQAKIVYQNRGHVDGQPDQETPPTPPVTVTPPPSDPSLTKKINKTLDHLDITTQENYNYDIETVLPSDIDKYKKFVIEDVLDGDLAPQEASIVGDLAQAFDVQVDGQTVRASLKDPSQAKDLAGKTAHLVIKDQIRKGVTREKIPNQAKIVYQNRSHVDGQPDQETPPTPPVTVTPPPSDPSLTKKINKTLDHLDIATQENYNYDIETVLPSDIDKYKKFVIEDVLDGGLAPQEASIVGDLAQAFDVQVEGQTVRASLKDPSQAKDLAGKTAHLVIKAQIRKGVTREKIPNQAKIVYQNRSHVDGQPDQETPPTPPVTVTPPPGQEPEIDKKINGTLTELSIDKGKSYHYDINVTLPEDIASYKEFVVRDMVDPALAINGQISMDLDGHKIDQAVTSTVDGNNFSLEVTDFKAFAGGKKLHIFLPATIRTDADLSAYENQKVPNKAQVSFKNINDGEGRKETQPVFVTPPPEKETPPPPPPGEPRKTINSVNGQEGITSGMNLLSPQDQFRYDISSLVADRYQVFRMEDQLEPVLEVEKVSLKLEGQSLLAQELQETEKDLKSAKEKMQALEDKSAPKELEEWNRRLEDAQKALTQLENQDKAESEEALTLKKEVQDLSLKIKEATDPALEVEKRNQALEVSKLEKSFETEIEQASFLKDLTDILSRVNAKGEIAEGDLAKLGAVKVVNNQVSFEVKDEKVLQALRGYQVTLSIYSRIKTGTDLRNYLQDGVENEATVTFNETPKVTNKVWVKPPKPEEPPHESTPPKDPPTSGDKTPPPSGDQPPSPKPGTKGGNPPHGPGLPKTGEKDGWLVITVGMLILVVFGGFVYRRKYA